MARSEVDSFHGMVGRSAAMQALFRQIERVAALDTPVLIRGELGTEKDLVAAALHALSARRDQPYEVTDCRAGYGLLAPMVLADLLGCEPGVAVLEGYDGPGAAMRADGGILFLHEAVELSLDAQQNVLTLIDRGEAQAIGSATPRRANVRVLASTCDQVERAVARGFFHETLYERLCVNALRVPPVRDRRQDIPLLVDRARRQHNARFGLSISGVKPEALAILEAHDWPGNLEEMEAVLCEPMVMQGSGWLGSTAFPRMRRKTWSPGICRCCCVRHEGRESWGSGRGHWDRDSQPQSRRGPPARGCRRPRR